MNRREPVDDDGDDYGRGGGKRLTPLLAPVPSPSEKKITSFTPLLAVLLATTDRPEQTRGGNS
jgi:hypothetical protein